MATNEKIYPKRNGRELSKKERKLFDRFQEEFEKTLCFARETGLHANLAYNLAARAIWELQDYNPKD